MISGIRLLRSALIALVVAAPLLLGSAAVQLISVRDDSSPVSVGGNEDSGSAVLSADGRYVLFASMSANLTVISNPAPQSGLLPRRQQVFLRDRQTAAAALVSFNLAGNYGGNDDSFPAAISTNGQFALFESAASDLVSSDTNNATDIFLRDVLSGTNLLMSVRTNGGSGNRTSRHATMTPDARYIAFVSVANNLVAGDTNGIPDVFVRDRVAGTTTLVSVGARSTGSASILVGSSEAPEITPDGRYVAFFSTATNLVPGVTNVGEVYVRDLVVGTTVMASTNARALLQSAVGTQNGISCNHRISEDGRYVAFVTTTNPIASFNSRGVAMRRDLQAGVTQIIHTNVNVPNLVPEDIRTLDFTPDGRFVAFIGNTNVSGNVAQAVYQWDGQSATTALVSGNLAGGVTLGTSCDWPSMDASGRYVAFVCSGENLVGNTLVGLPQLYLRDMQSGVTELLSQNAAGVGYAVNTLTAPAVSADGQVVVFDAWDGELTPADNNRVNDVFSRDRGVLATEMISQRDATLPALTVPSGAGSGSGLASVSYDGRFVAFVSDAPITPTGNANGLRNVFVRDLFLRTNYLVSAATNGTGGNGHSIHPVISGDGRYVAFTSHANNLVAGDNNNFADVFLCDLKTGTRSLVSVKTNANANGDSQLPLISADGRYVTFRSVAQNLTTTTTAGENLFQRDLQTGITRALTTLGLNSWAQTPDGSRMAFVGQIPGDLAAKIYVWSSTTMARIYTNNAASPWLISISPNGQRLAYMVIGGTPALHTAHLISNTNGLVSTGPFPSRVGLKFSTDGRYLAYATAANKINDSNGAHDVWLYDFVAGTNIQVCERYDAVFTPNGPSDSPDISPDGRFVVYRSLATNAVPNDQNNVADVLLFDRGSNTTFLVSRAAAMNRPANGLSMMPVFSGDGQTLVFASWASDLQTGDFNNASDIIGLALPTAAITDSDGDQMDDTWEMQFFGTLARNGTLDFDGDGMSDFLEFQTLTNPTNQSSAFRAELGLAPEPEIRWSAQPWRSYQVQYLDATDPGAWQTLSNTPSLSDGVGKMSDPAPSAAQRYYRVLRKP
jgi:Tol biopolymer transport system component